jgi:4-amino-4-deoxychorismate lyase
MSALLINGRQADTILATDRGLQYGDGLFETVSCVQGRPRWLGLHFERLRRGLARLQLPFDDFAALEGELSGLAAGQDRCLVKVTITRGPATRRGYAPAGDELPTRIVSRHEWPVTPQPGSQFRLGLSEVPLGLNPLLAGLKHLNRLEQVMAQQRLSGSGLNEVLMRAATGELISGSMSNVFIVKPPELITPALHACGVEGVMRRLVLESAADCGLTPTVRQVAAAELPGAHEILVTNVRLGVQPVNWYQGQALAASVFGRRLQEHIDATWR